MNDNEHVSPTGHESSPEEYWEGEYSGSEARWSGEVNGTMAEVVSELPAGPGRSALDLGCGEGGDAVWLACQGWRVTAIDISATATGRGAELARTAGVSEAITWVTRDLATWETTETFDLVTASFFHSTVELPREQILRRAAGQIRSGGHLLLVTHVFEGPDDIPEWSLRYHGTDDPNDPELQNHFSVLKTPSEEVAALDLDDADWTLEKQEIRLREATGPDGMETATVKDGVILLRRN
ncbi:class I SAM-dependent methyltransferase [Brevibacterium atlanticum]|uniref:class I SAM-dependent methyltransferase n=1 Tax=Brevibacterium atlanticum TaxID=2697563 RepID=UPI0014234C35|nr:class I SAM-dependent methyltransferase [Brevibacterium atlanticum]